MAKLFLFLALSATTFSSLLSQEVLDEFFRQITEEYFPEEMNESGISERIEMLVFIYHHPYNINTVNEEELQELFFLNDFEIFLFLEYRTNYGLILSLKELELVMGLKPDKIKLLNHFLICGDKQKTGILQKKNRNGRHKILNRYKLEFPLRKGFNTDHDSSLVFSGPPVYRLIKYELLIHDRFKAGITLESDPGEARLLKKGPDFKSAFFEMENQKWKLKKLILGNYRLNSGYGLIHGSGLNSKSSQVLLNQKFNQLKVFSSSSEYGFFSGIATELKFGKFSPIIYLSRTRHSANLKKENDQIYISAFQNGGLHRNMREQNIRNTLNQFQTGCINSFRFDKLQFSYILNFNHLSIPYFKPVYLLENQKIRAEKGYLNQSLSLNYRTSRVQFFGELAFDKHFSHAGIIAGNFRIHPLLTISCSWRDYSKNYISWNSSSLAEKSRIQNEKAFYFGAEFYPIRILKLSFYSDFYRFPWLNYNESHPVYGNDHFLKGEWKISRKMTGISLIKYERAFTNSSSEESPMDQMMETHSARFSLQSIYQADNQLKFSNKIEFKRFQRNNNEFVGILAYQGIQRKWLNDKISMDLRYTIFDIPNWETRIYSWEPDLLYSFSMPLFYRRGQSYLINFRFRTEKLNIGLKISETKYLNEIESGSGADYRKGRVFRSVKFQWILKI